MFEKFTLIVLAIISISGCASTSKKVEAEFESVVKTNGYYYSEGNQAAVKSLEEQFAKHNLDKELLESMLGERKYYVVTFDDLASNKLTYITLSKPVVDGKIDETSITRKISSRYSISSDQKGGYRIRFYENTEKLNSDFILRANKKGDIVNFTFIEK
jgi:hypothetical protein